MNLSKKKVLRLVIGIVLILITFLIYTYISRPTKLIVIYGPEDMYYAFKSTLNNTDLGKCKIVMDTKSKNEACIVVEYNKENDNNYTQIAFSPFVIGYNSKSELSEKPEKFNIFAESKFSSDIYDFDFSKLINAINNDNVEELGFNKNLIIICPSGDSIYWHDFYNFMLVNANNGSYPYSQAEMKRVKEKLLVFFDSSHIKMTNNFETQLALTEGFSDKVLYIMPEHELLQISSYNEYSPMVFYPINTVNFNYYAKSNSPDGAKIIYNTNSDTFANKLHSQFYRCSKNASILTKSKYSDHGQRDSYNEIRVN